MGRSLVTLVLVCVCAVIIGVLGRVLYLVWLKPKIPGNKYRLLTGDMNDEKAAFRDAWSKLMELTHKIAPCVIPDHHHMVKR